jgi:hypothetical protein
VNIKVCMMQHDRTERQRQSYQDGASLSTNLKMDLFGNLLNK